MQSLAAWPPSLLGSLPGSLPALAALAIPCALALAGLVAPRRAGLASGAALLLALIFSAAIFSAAIFSTFAPSISGLGAATAASASTVGLRADHLTCLMLLLITSLGALIARFSPTYLAGDPGLPRYLRWLLLTLAAVAVLVLANNLLVMALAWTATSLTLHQLLTFYADRPAALIAAHKKFLVSRLADAALAGSLGLVHANVGSFDLDRLASWVSARPELPTSMQVAAGLLVLAVALRSAQLPFHGWITQVMEAPTPVSALLHAGVVNIGGFVLIRLAPWMSRAEPAQLALVAIGLVTATVAALIMTTRVSIKMALAWSTCAQMGFLLVQCGLGLWSLALLHLIAHSLYKAHAFLAAGSAAEEWQRRALAPPRPPVAPLRLGVAVLVAAGLAAAAQAAQAALSAQPTHAPSAIVLALVLGLALTPLLTAGPTSGARAVAATLGRLAAVLLLTLGWHALAERVVSVPSPAAGALGWWLTGGALAALFLVKSALQLRPGGALARALHPWLFAGLYLDDHFTRLAFRVWPPRLPRPARPQERSALPPPAPAVLEVHS